MSSEPNWRRSFWALIVTQFQGAFSLNAFEYLLLYIVLSNDMLRERRDQLVSVIPLFLAAPFLLFSMAGGFLADRFSKRRVTVSTKVIEIGAMSLAVIALALRSQPLELVALFLLATQAALFGPSKYGLLPEILPEKWLSWGNGILELGTFLAIISGMICAAQFADRFRGREVYAGAILLGLAVVGFCSSLLIGRYPAAAPLKKFRLNFLGDLWQQVRVIRADRPLFLAILGNTYFWFLGTLFLQTVLVYGTDVFHLAPGQNSVLHAGTALGIGAGSAIAGYLSGNKIEYGLIPLGALGMTVMAALVGGMSHSFAAAGTLLPILG